MNGNRQPRGVLFDLGGTLLHELHFDRMGGRARILEIAENPKKATLADYAAALHVATLIEDGGTIQIGIGGFADALTQALKIRHTDNQKFRALTASLGLEQLSGSS